MDLEIWILLHYRTTPHATTGQTPAQLLMGRSPRTRLDMLRPDVRARVESKQLSQKSSHDGRVRERSFKPQDKVYVREAGVSSPWIPGMIESKQGIVHYEVRLEDGRLVKRHIDHVQPRYSASPTIQQQEEIPHAADVPSPPETTSPQSDESRDQQEPGLPRRSPRIRSQPVRYGYPPPTTEGPTS